MTAVGVLKEEPIANDVQEMILSMEPWLILVVAVIIAPIMEELVFRKFLLDRIAGFGHWTAMTVSGVIFGIAHGNFYQFFYAFGLGMIFAYMYLHTGKISYTISFHILINFCGSILPIGLLEILKKYDGHVWICDLCSNSFNLLLEIFIFLARSYQSLC